MIKYPWYWVSEEIFLVLRGIRAGYVNFLLLHFIYDFLNFKHRNLIQFLNV